LIVAVASILLYNSNVVKATPSTDPVFMTYGSTAYMSAQVKDANGAFVPNGTPINFYLNGTQYKQISTNNGYVTCITPAQDIPLVANPQTVVAKTPDGAVVSNSMLLYVGSATAAPVVSIASPVANATVTGIVPVKIQAGAFAGITTVQLFVDGVLKSSIAGNTNSQIMDTYTINLDTATLSTGTHTLQAKAINGYNVTGSSAVESVTVSNTPTDTTAPTITITSPVIGQVVTGTSGNVPVGISGTASDSGSGIASVKVSVDGGAYQLASGTTSWSASVTITTFAQHTISVQATDGASNTTTVSFKLAPTVSFTVSN